MTAPLRVELKRSAGAAAVLFAAHLAAATGAITVLPVPAAVLVVAALILSAGKVWKVLGSHARGSVVEVKILQDGAAYLRFNSGDWCAARLDRGSVALPWLVALVFQDQSGRKKPVLAYPGRTSDDALRRLRVWAAHAAHATGKSGAPSPSGQDHLGMR